MIFNFWPPCFIFFFSVIVNLFFFFCFPLFSRWALHRIFYSKESKCYAFQKIFLKKKWFFSFFFRKNLYYLLIIYSLNISSIRIQEFFFINCFPFANNLNFQLIILQLFNNILNFNHLKKKLQTNKISTILGKNILIPTLCFPFLKGQFMNRSPSTSTRRCHGNKGEFVFQGIRILST